MKFSKLYLLYFIMSVLLILSIAVYFSWSSLDDALNAKKAELISVKNKIKQEENKAVQLKNFVARNGLKPVNKETAKSIIFNTLNQFLALYDARITKPLTEENGLYKVSLSFKYYPDNSEELIQFIESLKQQKYPVLMIDRFTYENLKEGTVVSLEITMEQPFVR